MSLIVQGNGDKKESMWETGRDDTHHRAVASQQVSSSLLRKYRKFSIPTDPTVLATVSWTKVHFSSKITPFPRIYFGTTQPPGNGGEVYLFGGLMLVSVKEEIFRNCHDLFSLVPSVSDGSITATLIETTGTQPFCTSVVGIAHFDEKLFGMPLKDITNRLSLVGSTVLLNRDWVTRGNMIQPCIC
jgi:hypothetical protein